MMTSSAEQPANLLTVDQVAERLQAAPRTIRRLVKSGELIAYRLGRLVRISESDLANFLRARHDLD